MEPALVVAAKLIFLKNRTLTLKTHQSSKRKYYFTPESRETYSFERTIQVKDLIKEGSQFLK